MSLNRTTQPGPVSPGGGEQACQRHKQVSHSSESGESLRHVGCYSTVERSGEAGPAMVRLRLATFCALKEKRDEGSTGARGSGPAPQSSITFAPKP